MRQILKISTALNWRKDLLFFSTPAAGASLHGLFIVEPWKSTCYAIAKLFLKCHLVFEKLPSIVIYLD
jgi:hypothetical protein